MRKEAFVDRLGCWRSFSESGEMGTILILFCVFNSIFLFFWYALILLAIFFYLLTAAFILQFKIFSLRFKPIKLIPIIHKIDRLSVNLVCWRSLYLVDLIFSLIFTLALHFRQHTSPVIIQHFIFNRLTFSSKLLTPKPNGRLQTNSISLFYLLLCILASQFIFKLIYPTFSNFLLNYFLFFEYFSLCFL